MQILVDVYTRMLLGRHSFSLISNSQVAASRVTAFRLLLRYDELKNYELILVYIFRIIYFQQGAQPSVCHVMSITTSVTAESAAHITARALALVGYSTLS